jgi:hypothetical protein
LRGGREYHTFGISESIGADARRASVIGYANVIEGPLLLTGNVGRVRVGHIEGPLTFGRLAAQLAIDLLLGQRLNGIHALVLALSAFMTVFGRVRV